MFASVVAELSNPNIDNISQSKQRLNVALDKDMNTVMCNNYIGGREIFGYIDPKPMSITTQLMFPKRIKTAIKQKESTDFERWANRTVVEMDRCCMETLAYTYIWDRIINACLTTNNITPCVYHMVYLMMKVMSRTPRIPPGTILYRGSSIPFDQYDKNMRFMSFTTDITVAKKFAKDGYIGMYTVKSTDYIHGLWLDRDHGTSNFYEQEIVIGPGIYIDSVGDLVYHKNPNFTNDGDLVFNVIADIFKPKKFLGVLAYAQVYPLELKQQNIGTYFMDNYIPDADEHFRRVVESGCVLFGDYKDQRCMINSFYQTVFKDWEENKYCYKLENLGPATCGYMYLAVINNQHMKISLSDAVRSNPDSAGLRIPKKVCVYRILNNNEDMCCTLNEMIRWAFDGNDIVVIPMGVTLADLDNFRQTHIVNK